MFFEERAHAPLTHDGQTHRLFYEAPATLVNSAKSSTKYLIYLSGAEPMHRKEHRSIIKAVKNVLAAESSWDTSVLLLNDNLGMCLAVRKGRCKDAPTLMLLKKMGASFWWWASLCRCDGCLVSSILQMALAGQLSHSSSRSSHTRTRQACEPACLARAKRKTVEHLPLLANRARPSQQVDICQNKGGTNNTAHIVQHILPSCKCPPAPRRNRVRIEKRDAAMQLGVIEETSVTESTRAWHKAGLEQLKRFARWPSLKVSVAALDVKLAEYFDSMFMEERDSSAGTRILAALLFYGPLLLGYKPSLSRAVRSLKGWKRRIPLRTRKPLPWNALAAIAMQLAKMHKPHQAVCWLVMVDTYLRPTELIEMAPHQLIPPQQQKGMSHAVLLINPNNRQKYSKTGELDESLHNSRPWLSQVMVPYWQTRKRATRIWPFNFSRMRLDFLAATRSLGLAALKPCLYLARHRGASLDRLQNKMRLLEVQRRGRWRSETSVRRYKTRHSAGCGQSADRKTTVHFQQRVGPLSTVHAAAPPIAPKTHPHPKIRAPFHRLVFGKRTAHKADAQEGVTPSSVLTYDKWSKDMCSSTVSWIVS